MIIGIGYKMRAGKDTTGRIIQFLTQKYNEITLQEMLDYSSTQQPPTTEWQVKKFAGKLKQCISIVTGISLDDLEKEYVKNRELPEEWNRIWTNPVNGVVETMPMTVRQLLQEFGTEGCRSIHSDFWVNSLFADYKPTLTDDSKEELQKYLSKPKKYKESIVEYKNTNWIITDLRFPNEAEAIKVRGGILIKVERNTGGVDLHNINYSKHSSESALDDFEFDYVIDNNSDIPTLIENVSKVLRQENII